MKNYFFVVFQLNLTSCPGNSECGWGYQGFDGTSH